MATCINNRTPAIHISSMADVLKKLEGLSKELDMITSSYHSVIKQVSSPEVIKKCLTEDFSRIKPCEGPQTRRRAKAEVDRQGESPYMSDDEFKPKKKLKKVAYSAMQVVRSKSDAFDDQIFIEGSIQTE